MADENNEQKPGYIGPGHYPIKIEVISQKGHCHLGHKVGDTWTVAHVTPGGMCIGAFQSMALQLKMLEFGGQFPWKPDMDTHEVACPDGDNPVIFKLTRIREQPPKE
jgi:uncharacterized repeat protein (TIGR04076 family)